MVMLKLNLNLTIVTSMCTVLCLQSRTVVDTKPKENYQETGHRCLSVGTSWSGEHEWIIGLVIKITVVM